MSTLVLGLGNTLLSDEGIGIHVIDHLQNQPGLPLNVSFMDGGTLSFTLAGPIEESDNLIVIDAAELNTAPGTVSVFSGPDMDQYLGTNRKRSVHEVGLIDLMNIARLTDRLPARRALIAIQPERVDWGEQPSPKVATAIPEACNQVLAILREWHP